MGSPEFAYPVRSSCSDNIPYVEFAVLHTYVYHLCLHDGCMSNNVFILGRHCYGSAMEFLIMIAILSVHLLVLGLLQYVFLENLIMNLY